MSASPAISNELYVVYAADAPTDRIVEDPNGGRRKGGVQRMSYMKEHNDYQVATSFPDHPCFVHKQAAVPMLAADGITMIGSCFLVKASREECERFIQMDPFYTNKVWASVSITKFSAAATKSAARTPQEEQQRVAESYPTRRV